ncbi:MAG: ABC transporter substrate-binding protein [Dehalococcoidales bacterium]|nr:ABC transporter substrate-binding protein [Dehalococcoidales bacterium]
MKKILFIAVALILVSVMVLTGCAKPQPTPTASPKPTASPTPTKTATPTAPATTPTKTAEPSPTGPTPKYGGVLRIIATSGPQMMSYVPMMGPGDRSAIFPAAEALVDTTTERGAFTSGIEPSLAEKAEVDPAKLTITFKIRKGIKFHDGSELTAEVARWNLQQVIDAGAMPYMDYFDGFEIPDQYTLVIKMKKYNNQMMPTWGWWTAMYSKQAWEKASGGDLQKGIEWARTNIVGTGPFMLKEYQRDVKIVWTKNPNYWKPNRPYLDGIEVTIIPDAVTARAAFEAGQADIWGAPPKDAKELIAKGYKKQSAWPTLPWGLWPNTSNPDSKMKKKNLREAVEYALDKEGITQALGHGLYKTIKALPWEGEWGHDPSMGREYNPDKAKQLLAAEGYSLTNRCKINLLTTNAFGPTPIDACTMIKQQLDAVGFDVTIDIADAGRFFGTIYGKTNVPSADIDLSFYFAGGNDTNYLQTYIRWFSNDPFTWLSFLGRTPEQAEMDKQAMAAVNIADQVEWTKKLMRYMYDNCLIIPIYGVVAYVIQQPYVHSTQYTQGFVRWQTEEVWLDKR